MLSSGKSKTRHSIQMLSFSPPSAWGYCNIRSVHTVGFSCLPAGCCSSSLPTSRTQVGGGGGVGGNCCHCSAIAITITLSAEHPQLPPPSAMSLHMRTFFGHWSPLLAHPDQARTSEEFMLRGASLNTWLTRIDGDPAPLVIILGYILHCIQSRTELQLP